MEEDPHDKTLSAKHRPKRFWFWAICLVALVLNCVGDYYHPVGILFDVVLIPVLLWRIAVTTSPTSQHRN